MRVRAVGGYKAATCLILSFGLFGCGESGPTDADVLRVDRPILFHDFQNLFVTDTTGGDVRPLTNETNMRTAALPLWSPTGRHIVVRAQVGMGSNELWVLNSDGTGLRQVSASALPVNGISAWSPDGDRLVYLDVDRQMYVVSRDGQNHRALLSAGARARNPAWSPSGEWIAFVGRDGQQSGLFRVRPDGTGLQLLDSTAGSQGGPPAYSPSGRRIAFTEGGAIYLINADGGGRTAFSTPLGEADEFPVWSYDGRRIAHRRQAANQGRWRVEVREVASGALLATFGRPTVDAAYPSWSPDGDRLTFSVGNQMVTASISDPAELRFLGEGAWPRWHPGG